MTYDPWRHDRRSSRNPRHDYSRTSLYFVTLCTESRDCLFGEALPGGIILNRYGELVRDEWWRSAALRIELGLDALVIMPNHLHAVVSILSGSSSDRVGAHGRAPLLFRPSKSLGSFIAGFKSLTTKRINDLRGTPGTRVWQRNYHERIIRGGEELQRVRDYIASNPAEWESDDENPINRPTVARRAASIVP